MAAPAVAPVWTHGHVLGDSRWGGFAGHPCAESVWGHVDSLTTVLPGKVAPDTLGT